jgi:hypothetical protein
MNEVLKWKIAVAVFVAALIGVLIMSSLAFDDLNRERNRKAGTAIVSAGFFFGLANMDLSAGDSVNYEYSSETSILFVVRMYNGYQDSQYSGIELVNNTGASGSGAFTVSTTGFYVFQVLSSDEAANEMVVFDFYKDVPFELNRPYSEAGIMVVMFGVSVAILVAGMQWAAGSPQKGSPFLVFWRIFVTNWQSWSPSIAGALVVVVCLLLRVLSHGVWDNTALVWANDIGRGAVVWGLLLGMTHVPGGRRNRTNEQ